jgi:pimeloyl-ACP methyl ester carboxylesterase
VIAETPVFFEASGCRLFGIITHPDTPNGVGVLIIQGGDTVNVSLHRNRLAVQMARDLAARGYTPLRFDYHGLGESTGTIGELRLSDPFSEDAVAAAEVLRLTGVSSIVLIGACFSARTALSAAPLLDDVGAVLMATPPVGNYGRSEAVAERMARDRSLSDYASYALRVKTVKSLADPVHRAFYTKLAKSKLKQVTRKVTGGVKPTGSRDRLWWVDRQMLEPLDEMVTRAVPVLIVFGVDDPLLTEFDRAKEGSLGEILARGDGVVEVARDLPGAIHGFPSLEGQEAFLELAYEWIERATKPQHR